MNKLLGLAHLWHAGVTEYKLVGKSYLTLFRLPSPQPSGAIALQPMNADPK